jgi:prepilin-type N-terminal cleavage/methylation domain-containing protein
MAAPGLLESPLMRGYPHVRRRQGGFSFIEVLMTMTLLAIVLAIVIPNFRAVGETYALGQAASQVAADFQATRMRAIAANATYRFAYDSSTKTYSMERQNGLAWVVERRSQLPTGVTVGTVASTPTFNSRGMLNQAVSIPLSANGKTKTVTVNVLGQTTIS